MKGQAFSTFKILIGSVFAVVMLGIVYYAVSTYSPPMSGLDLMGDMVKQATNAPGNCFSRHSAEFTAGETISADSFLPLNINHFYDRNQAISCLTRECSIIADTKTPMSAVCSISSSEIQCDVYLGSDTCS